MRIFLIVCTLVLMSCGRNQQMDDRANSRHDAQDIEKEIVDFHVALKQLYNGASLNVDSLYQYYFDSRGLYVTYWGTTEPIDSTKSRIKRALPFMKDYTNRLESISIRTFGTGASVFFVLRQSYELNGHILDEYLPTTFVMQKTEDHWQVIQSHRSADFQTIQQLMELARLREKGK